MPSGGKDLLVADLEREVTAQCLVPVLLVAEVEGLRADLSKQAVAKVNARVTPCRSHSSMPTYQRDLQSFDLLWRC